MVNYPKHLDGFSYVGRYRYFLTFCTQDRNPLFVEASVVSCAWTQILRAASEDAMDVIAYCFMPDHAHLVMGGREETSDLLRFIAKAKQFSGYTHSQKHGRQRLWQRYGHERTLRSDESTQSVVRYVLENPVRKGMVDHPREYPFIGSSSYTISELLEFAYSEKVDGSRRYQAG
jgi:putative transposase